MKVFITILMIIYICVLVGQCIYNRSIEKRKREEVLKQYEEEKE